MAKSNPGDRVPYANTSELQKSCVLNNLGNALLNLNRLDEARAAYQRAIATTPAYLKFRD